MSWLHEPDVVNAIHCELPVLAFIQHPLIQEFPSTVFRYSKSFVIDVTEKSEQLEIAVTEHNRAHRAAQRNVKQIQSDYLFPKMTRIVTEIVTNFTVCSKGKYNRHPEKQAISKTPVPTSLGEILHVDIFSTDGKYFLTAVDKFSKFASVQPITSRAIIDINTPLLQLANLFPKIKTLYCDNERSLNSETIKSILTGNFGISIANCRPLHSTSNEMVERFLRTLAEIAR